MADPRSIEAVTAVIVLSEGHNANAEDIAAHYATHLSGFKLPKQIIFQQGLLRNASSKILKRELRLSLLEVQD